MKIKYSHFASLSLSKAHKIEADWGSMDERLSPQIGDKTGTGYTFALFREGGRRQLRDLECHTALVLDFDSQEKSVAKKKHEIAELLQDYSFLLVDTYSNSEDLPCYRLILPFSKPVAAQDFFQVQADVIELLGFPPAIDEQVRKNPTQFYFYSRHPEKNLELIFNDAEFYTPDVSDFDCKKLAEQNSKIQNSSFTGATGRNNALKAQCCAAMEAGKSVGETVDELLAYDITNHIPPLFEDPKEGGFPDDPSLAAMRFVTSIYCSQKQNHNMPTNESIKVETIDIEELRKQKKETAKEKIFFEEQLALDAPGLLGEIVDYIVKTARKPQPVLALGAAIALLGHVKGHRYRTETDLRTNMYCLGIAPSASGKEHNSKAVRKLIQLIEDDDSLVGEPASEPALSNSIQRVKGRALLCWGEIGMIFREMSRPNSPRRVIVRAMNEFLTCANGLYVTRSYAANKDGRESTKIDQPHLCVWAESAPEPVFDSLDTSFVDDGFLPRWLLFPVSRKSVKKRLFEIDESLQKNIVNQLKNIIQQNQRKSRTQTIEAKLVHFASDTKEILEELDSEFDKLKEELDAKNPRLGTIVSRAFEHTIKLALIACDNRAITKKDLRWASNVVKSSLMYAIHIVENEICESDFQKLVSKAIKFINNKGGFASQRDISRNLRVKVKELAEVENFLLNSGQIEVKEVKNEKANSSKIWAIN